MATASFAHVSLSESSAPAGSTYRATLRVGHGCGESPTTTFKVLLPEGFKGAKPMPKAGWRLTFTRTALARPYDNHGKLVTDDVSEVTWSAMSPDAWLPNDQYDEFVLRGGLPNTAGPLWFKVLQSCEQGVNAWTEVPTSGTSTKDLKFPAVLLNVVQPAPALHQH